MSQISPADDRGHGGIIRRHHGLISRRRFRSCPGFSRHGRGVTKHGERFRTGRCLPHWGRHRRHIHQRTASSSRIFLSDDARVQSLPRRWNCELPATIATATQSARRRSAGGSGAYEACAPWHCKRQSATVRPRGAWNSGFGGRRTARCSGLCPKIAVSAAGTRPVSGVRTRACRCHRPQLASDHIASDHIKDRARETLNIRA